MCVLHFRISIVLLINIRTCLFFIGDDLAWWIGTVEGPKAHAVSEEIPSVDSEISIAEELPSQVSETMEE